MPPIQSAVLPAPRHTSTGSSLPAPAGVVAAGVGSRFTSAGLFTCVPSGAWLRAGPRHSLVARGLSMTNWERRA